VKTGQSGYVCCGRFANDKRRSILSTLTKPAGIGGLRGALQTPQKTRDSDRVRMHVLLNRKLELLYMLQSAISGIFSIFESQFQFYCF
jgi:hypothetical protein